MKALVLDNKVIEIAESEFPVHSSLVWMDAPEACQTGWIFENSVLRAEVEPEPTEQEVLDEYKQAIKQLLYNKAQEKDYDSEQSIASYATSTNEDWKAEAQQFVQCRDTVYEYSLGVLSDVQAELIEPPTMHDFLKDVPDFNWIK